MKTDPVIILVSVIMTVVAGLGLVAAKHFYKRRSKMTQEERDAERHELHRW